MRINHNIAALNTHRQLGANNAQASKNLEKLSSGLKINRAGDDAAGLAISEKMRGQIRGLDMASKNAQDGISLIQTAEGALNETHAILQRMSELAVQSSNDTNTDSDRSEIQKEINELTKEIDRISSDTEFNTKKLLNGNVGQTASLGANTAHVGAGKALDGSLEGTYTLDFTNTTVDVENVVSAGGIAAGDITIENVDNFGAGLKAGSYTIEVSGDADNATFTLKDASGNALGTITGDSAAGDLTIQVGGQDAITIATGAYNGNEGTLKFDVAITTDVAITNADGKVTTHTGVKANSNSTISVGGMELDVKTNLQNATTEIDVNNNGLYFHIGANENQVTRLGINEISSSSLKIDDLDVSTQAGAEAAITKVQAAVEKVSAERSKLGAVQNRLEHTINNLGTSSENLTAAESRIRDVDMAKEMMEFTKNNILTQAAQAMLAQANQQPQGVLQLLR